MRLDGLFRPERPRNAKRERTLLDQVHELRELAALMKGVRDGDFLGGDAPLRRHARGSTQTDVAAPIAYSAEQRSPDERRVNDRIRAVKKEPADLPPDIAV